MMSYSAHPDGGRAIVVPPAEIDIENTKQLQDELNAAIDRGIATVVVDMSRTTFCDSAGARVLLRAHERASDMKTDMRIVITEQTVQRVFELLGIDQMIRTYTSLEAAQNDATDGDAAS